jgi:hypothetical protein
VIGARNPPCRWQARKHLSTAAPGSACTSLVSITGGILSITVVAAAGGTATPVTTGAGTQAETIPLSDVSYDVTGLSQAAGPAIFATVPPTNLAGSPRAVVTATRVSGGGSSGRSCNPAGDLTTVRFPGAASHGEPGASAGIRIRSRWATRALSRVASSRMTRAANRPIPTPDKRRSSR